jgi:hypothetical protein
MDTPRDTPITVLPQPDGPLSDAEIEILTDIDNPPPTRAKGNGQVNPPPTPAELADDALAASEQVEAADRLMGTPVDPELSISPEEVWLDPLEALLQDSATELPEDDFPIKRLKTKLRFRAIPTPRYNRIQADFTVRRRDTKTGEIVTTLRDREMKVQVIIESCTNFDFGEKRVWRKFNVNDVNACVERVLLPGEIDQAAIFVRELSGFGFADLEEEAGNS